MTDKETIQQSILNVSAAIGAIGKDKRAKIKTQGGAEFGYNFRGIDDVLDALHPALITAGVTITPQVKDMLVVNDGVLLTIDYVISNVHGDTTVATFVGEGRDRGDKAAQKAMSNAYKYMAFQTFCIPVVVDDSDSNQYQRPPEPAQQASEPVKLSQADTRMKAIKDHAWQLTTGDTDELHIAEAMALVEQSLATFGGPPKNKGEVDTIVANMDEMYSNE